MTLMGKALMAFVKQWLNSSNIYPFRKVRGIEETVGKRADLTVTTSPKSIVECYR